MIQRRKLIFAWLIWLWSLCGAARADTALLMEHWQQILFIPCFLLGWVALSYQIGYFSGWYRLARSFRTDEPLDGERFRFASGSMGWSAMPAKYNHCLFVDVNSDGFRLSIFFLFRLGCPPLFIPWSQISSVTQKKVLFWSKTVFHFRDTTLPSIDLRGAAAAGMQDAYERHQRRLLRQQIQDRTGAVSMVSIRPAR